MHACVCVLACAHGTAQACARACVHAYVHTCVHVFSGRTAEGYVDGLKATTTLLPIYLCDSALSGPILARTRKETVRVFWVLQERISARGLGILQSTAPFLESNASLPQEDKHVRTCVQTSGICVRTSMHGRVGACMCTCILAFMHAKCHAYKYASYVTIRFSS